ncbi:TRAF-type zinc finger domain-containing protein 1-like isoform X2 [Limulus polyphemus]|nr:TRAF-type zinc finger domain-containing protein 1-like isoform X2 [Limulus polyphemus]XP_022243143.1 TRAF-type zinc finger domain-containing protein 1-like isoform X2 [Limulus polyphemus]XP_022243144.1 TRAF-type zinc finger domain-containing protein 1-like isoform X2 [Limulus polyphemus]XP_022243145.1 TRAF-type zinc finger domain-containing protein 1-like isoform X2 [Limulus polyphemus]XP_022243146.1 TRAF-type zinc finger domain-containing protein 1-like isoform X2 [Limulus polyphemus]XP_02
MADEDTKYCSNCKRDIAISNYVLHSAHCQRNITLCSKCHEPVPRNELESHCNDVHKTVMCSKCGEMMEKGKLEDHQKESCSKRNAACKYCELEGSLDDVREHETYCGSRTEPCPACGQYVMKKNKDIHAGNYCKQMLEEELLSHDTGTLNNCRSQVQEKAGNSGKPVVRRNKLRNVRENRSSNHPVGIVDKPPPSPAFSGSLSHSPETRDLENLDHLLACQLAEEELNKDKNYQKGLNVNFCEDYGNLLDDNKGENEPNDFVKGVLKESCLYHKKLIRTDLDHFLATELEEGKLIKNQQHPKHNINQQDNYNNLLEFDTFGDGDTLSQYSKKNQWYADEVVNQDTAKEVVSLPCEFCGQQISEDDLILHQSGCQIDQHNEQEVNTRVEQEEEQKTKNLFSRFEAYTSSKKEQYKKCDSDHSEIIPCEFCKDPFSLHEIERHQSVCNSNSLLPLLPDTLYPPASFLRGLDSESGTGVSEFLNSKHLTKVSTPLVNLNIRRNFDQNKITNKKIPVNSTTPCGEAVGSLVHVNGSGKKKKKTEGIANCDNERDGRWQSRHRQEGRREMNVERENIGRVRQTKLSNSYLQEMKANLNHVRIPNEDLLHVAGARPKGDKSSNTSENIFLEEKSQLVTRKVYRKPNTNDPQSSKQHEFMSHSVEDEEENLPRQQYPGQNYRAGFMGKTKVPDV